MPHHLDVTRRRVAEATSPAAAMSSPTRQPRTTPPITWSVTQKPTKGEARWTGRTPRGTAATAGRCGSRRPSPRTTRSAARTRFRKVSGLAPGAAPTDLMNLKIQCLVCPKSGVSVPRLDAGPTRLGQTEAVRGLADEGRPSSSGPLLEPTDQPCGRDPAGRTWAPWPRRAAACGGLPRGPASADTPSRPAAKPAQVGFVRGELWQYPMACRCRSCGRPSPVVV